MTIVDILLHKWSYNTEARRRRQILLAALTLLLIAVVTLVFFLRSPAYGGDDSGGANGGLVASADSSAIASFRGELHFAGKSVPLAHLVELKSSSSTGQEQNNRGESIQIRLHFRNQIEIDANIITTAAADSKDNESRSVANSVSVSWLAKETGASLSRCRLDGAGHFETPRNKHYLCTMTRVYACKASDAMSMDAELVVDHFELELNRSTATRSLLRAWPQTEAHLCT